MIHIVKEYEKCVIFRLGKFKRVAAPGLVIIPPLLETGVKIDMRTFTINVPKQDVITKDNVTIKVDAMVYYNVTDPKKAVIAVHDFCSATTTLAQTILRDVLGNMELDDALTKREQINAELKELLDKGTDPWGICVSAVTISDISLPDTMLRAIAKQAEAEREKRARIILAEGEEISAKKMMEAAELYEKIPVAIRLRELQTLSEIAREKNMVIIEGKTDIASAIALSKGIK
ncbi:MAG: slipin family protein [Methanosarcinales archaeon]|jgi:regulator of protease activity HflC (stomatin/prohibitin superfamily)|nr:slipin family protein [Methanosarcinales archaeon]